MNTVLQSLIGPKPTVTIIGDSFSADYGQDSWVSMLSSNYVVNNFSQRGISQFRLYCIVHDNWSTIKNSDAIVIFHTNPDRVYIPNGVELATRALASHKTCDMVAENVINDEMFRAQARMYYKYFFDQTQQNVFYRLMVDDIKRLTQHHVCLHCSGFDVAVDKSFAELQRQHAGDLNHFDAVGNTVVYDYITAQLTNV